MQTIIFNNEKTNQKIIIDKDSIVFDIVDFDLIEDKIFNKKIIFKNNLSAIYITLYINGNNQQKTEEHQEVILNNFTNIQFYNFYLSNIKYTAEKKYTIKKNSHAYFKTISLSRATEHLKIKDKYIYDDENIKSEIKINMIQTDNSQNEYFGKIWITPKGKKTNTNLEMNAYLLSKQTYNIMIPALQIEHNDVKASHSGTIANFDEEDIFYLMSRGLNKKTIEQILTESIFFAILKEIPEHKITQKISRYLKQKINKIYG